MEVIVRDRVRGGGSADLSEVFHPFFSTKDVGDGYGLGLSVVHGIAHQAHGHVVVDSNRRAGTTIKILLPFGAGPQTRAPHVVASNVVG